MADKGVAVPGPNVEFFEGTSSLEKVIAFFFASTIAACGREKFESIKLKFFCKRILRSEILKRITVIT